MSASAATSSVLGAVLTRGSCWKARRPLQSLGPYFDPDGVGEGRFRVREYYCPGCVVLFEVEVATPGDPLLVDVELEFAGAAE